MDPGAVVRAGGAGLPPALPPAAQPHYLLRSEHPQVEVTWSSALLSERPRPDTLKLRKRVQAWPLEFTFKADYNTSSREFSYGMMCRDAVVRGDISINMPRRQLEYAKRLPLGGSGAVLALAASCRLEEDLRLKPDVRLTVEFGSHSSVRDGSARWVAGAGGASSFDVQQRFKVARGLSLEVCGNVALPSPAARYSPGSGQLVLGEGAFRVHVAEVNAVCYV